MLVQVHSAVTMLRGDGDGRNPRDLVSHSMPDGEALVGRFVDDGVRKSAPMNAPRRPDVPFQIYLPLDFMAWHALNARIFYALQRGDSPVLIDMRIPY